MPFLAFDFDDTLTDTTRTAAAFQERYQRELLRVLKRQAAAPAFEALRQQVQAAPGDHGWLRDGLIVARATSDAFILNRTVARLWLDEAQLFPRPEEREAILELMYSYCYETAPLRDETAEVFSALVKTTTVGVVSNSAPDKLRKVLDAFPDVSVVGHAEKYAVDAAWALPDSRPSQLVVPGLARPVEVRRRRYFEALASFSGGRWSELTVVGDNFELDLSLPLVMGAQVALVHTHATPAYEVDFVTARGGRVVHSLRELMS
jgi:hypothetical protein